MIPACEHLAQFVADDVDDGLVELRGHRLLDRVDHGQFAGALLGRRGALGDRALQPCGRAHWLASATGLAGQRRQQVVVGGLEAAARPSMSA